MEMSDWHLIRQVVGDGKDDSLSLTLQVDKRQFWDKGLDAWLRKKSGKPI